MSKFINWLRGSKPAPAPVEHVEAKMELPNEPLHAKSNEEILRSLAVSLAEEDLGQRELKGQNNRSPFIDKCNREAGAPLGTPWCAAGLTTRVYKRLCEKQGLKNPLKCTASSQLVASYVPKKYWVKEGGLAKRGCAFVQTKRNDSTRGHTGLVSQDMVKATRYETIEYNTNKIGSRDGDGVYRQTRSTSGDLTKRHRCFVDVIRWIMDENGLP